MKQTINILKRNISDCKRSNNNFLQNDAHKLNLRHIKVNINVNICC